MEINRDIVVGEKIKVADLVFSENNSLSREKY
jgi:hypothetical protein